MNLFATLCERGNPNTPLVVRVSADGEIAARAADHALHSFGMAVMVGKGHDNKRTDPGPQSTGYGLGVPFPRFAPGCQKRWAGISRISASVPNQAGVSIGGNQYSGADGDISP